MYAGLPAPDGGPPFHPPPALPQPRARILQIHMAIMAAGLGASASGLSAVWTHGEVVSAFLTRAVRDLDEHGAFEGHQGSGRAAHAIASASQMYQDNRASVEGSSSFWSPGVWYSFPLLIGRLVVTFQDTRMAVQDLIDKAQVEVCV